MCSSLVSMNYLHCNNRLLCKHGSHAMGRNRKLQCKVAGKMKQSLYPTHNATPPNYILSHIEAKAKKAIFPPKD